MKKTVIFTLASNKFQNKFNQDDRISEAKHIIKTMQHDLQTPEKCDMGKAYPILNKF